MTISTLISSTLQLHKDLLYCILNLIDENSLLSLKKTCLVGKQFFENEKIALYLISTRVPRLLQRIKTEHLPKEAQSQCVNVFFKIVLLLPQAMRFPAPADYGKNALTTLFTEVEKAVSKNFFRGPLKEKFEHITRIEDARIPAFMTRIPTRLIPFNVRGFVELSRRYPVPPLNDAEFNECFSLLILNTYNLSSGMWASSFVQGISPALFGFILQKNPENFFPGPALVTGFNNIHDPVDAHHKIVLMGQWYAKHCAQWHDGMQAHRLLYVLYMAALLDQRSPLERTLVKSWIPEKYQADWNLLLVDYLESDKPFLADELNVISARFGSLFKHSTKKQNRTHG